MKWCNCPYEYLWLPIVFYPKVLECHHLLALDFSSAHSAGLLPHSWLIQLDDHSSTFVSWKQTISALDLLIKDMIVVLFSISLTPHTFQRIIWFLPIRVHLSFKSPQFQSLLLLLLSQCQWRWLLLLFNLLFSFLFHPQDHAKNFIFKSYRINSKSLASFEHDSLGPSWCVNYAQST